MKDPNNNTTSYAYNGFGDQTSIVSPDTGTTTMTYNTGGMVYTKTDSRGKTSTYTYDVLGRMTQVSYNDTTTGTSKTYDVAANGVGQLSSLTDPSGSTSFTYDSNGRVATRTSVIAGLTKTINYSRDSLGRVSNIAYPSGTNVGMSYTNGRVVNITLNATPLISAIQYFPLGGPESWKLGADLPANLAYTRWIDTNSRIAQYATPIGYRGLTFDDGGRITAIKDYQGISMATLLGTQAFT